MNRLKKERQAAVISALVEGNSIRSTERMTGVHRDTIMRLTRRVGDACAKMTGSRMRDLPCKRLQVDEIWCYVNKKERHINGGDPEEFGDTWTFVAIDADSKVVPAWAIGKRTQDTAVRFIKDLAGRMANRVQLSSDGLGVYIWAVNLGFDCKVDYAQVVKSYEAEPFGPGRYSSPKVASIRKTTIIGEPDEEHISTSYIERQNLTMRTQMRRFTRLTNGFSKTIEGLEAAVALHFGHYNFCRVHRTLKTTPAVAIGLESKPWTVGDLVELAAN